MVPLLQVAGFELFRGKGSFGRGELLVAPRRELARIDHKGIGRQIAAHDALLGDCARNCARSNQKAQSDRFARRNHLEAKHIVNLTKNQRKNRQRRDLVRCRNAGPEGAGSFRTL